MPLWLMHLIAAGYEGYARATGRPVLLSCAMARTVAREDDRSRYSPAKSARELGLTFRPVAETLRDAAAWLLAHDHAAAEAHLLRWLGNRAELLTV